MTSLRILTAFALLSAALPAFAADDAAVDAHYSAAYDTCLKSAKAVRQIQECNAKEISYQEDALDRELDALGTAKPGDRDRLADEQKRWEDQVEAQCTVFSRRKGSLNSMKAQDCFRDETIKRRIALETEMPAKAP